jgi:hypothetical protein
MLLKKQKKNKQIRKKSKGCKSLLIKRNKKLKTPRELDRRKRQRQSEFKMKQPRQNKTG